MSYLIDLLKIFIASMVVNNIILMQFLGLCSYIGLTDNMSASIGMGYAVTFVTVLAAAVTWIIDHWILIPFNLQPFLEIVSFILVIGSLVSLVEIYLKKMSPNLYKAMGIYLPLIATNCLILGVTFVISMHKLDFIQALVEAIGTALGYFMAMLILAGIRERLRDSELPEFFQGKAIAYIVSGIAALAFMGFQGMIK